MIFLLAGNRSGRLPPTFLLIFRKLLWPYGINEGSNLQA